MRLAATSMISVLTMTPILAASAGQDRRVPIIRDFSGPLLVGEEVFRASVAQVNDGDSIVVTDRVDRLAIHLDGIDAPEMSQPYGPEARDFLSKLVFDRLVTVRLKGRLKDEGLARIELNGFDMSVALVRSGMAWSCGRHGDAPEIARGEQEARQAKLGLWRTPGATAPWTFRGVAACWQEKS